MLIVRSEISSTLGLKTAIWEVDEESESRRSQGDNCWLLLRKKLLLDANAIAKVKPSDLSTFVSPHGEYMWLLSDDSTRDEKQDVVRRRKKKIVSIFATFFLFLGFLRVQRLVRLFGLHSGRNGESERWRWKDASLLASTWKKIMDLFGLDQCIGKTRVWPKWYRCLIVYPSKFWSMTLHSYTYSTLLIIAK